MALPARDYEASVIDGRSSGAYDGNIGNMPIAMSIMRAAAEVWAVKPDGK